MNSASTEITIRWNQLALKEAKALSSTDRHCIVTAVEALRDDPLRGRPLHADWKGFHRLRVGEHRVIYAFDGAELLISVIRVGHRREVYR